MAGWLRRPIQITRATLLVIAFGLGMLAAGGILVGTIALRNVGQESAKRQEVDRLTTGDVEGIARRIFRLEQPTRAELLGRIERGLRLCERTPACVRRVQGVARGQQVLDDGSAAAGATAQAPAAGDSSPSTPTTRRPDRDDGSRPGNDDTSSPSTPDPSPSPGPDPSPGPAAPPVDVQTPAILQDVRVCTPLVGVNC